MAKRGVLVLNLGSPKSYAVDDVREYLREFLGDERVIDGNPLVRWLVLNCIILPRRPPRSAEAYKKVWLPEGAPLLVITARLAKALSESISPDIKLYTGMRYGEPSCAQAVAEVVRDGVEELFIMPQYPHFAMSSYETVVVRVMDEIGKQAPKLKVTTLEPFYNDPGYIRALVESAKPWLEKPFDKLLFSYHGVPLRHLRKEVPDYPICEEAVDCCPPNEKARARDYRHQCFVTMDRFAEYAGLSKEQYTISFQSRLGRSRWIQPYTDRTLEILPTQGVKKLLVICPAFTADCLETLEEISVEGRDTFLHAGGESFEQIPCLNDHPAYVQFLVEKIKEWGGRE
ncbi:MAG: ferrochelatase [Puniceicoccales bacterium]|jgi:ferrochelatase|nr:ferrochelatase [Puniceicoccales bacterium]